MDGERPEKEKITEPLQYKYFEGRTMLHLKFTDEAEQRKLKKKMKMPLKVEHISKKVCYISFFESKVVKL